MCDGQVKEGVVSHELDAVGRIERESRDGKGRDGVTVVTVVTA